MIFFALSFLSTTYVTEVSTGEAHEIPVGSKAGPYCGDLAHQEGSCLVELLVCEIWYVSQYAKGLSRIQKKM